MEKSEICSPKCGPEGEKKSGKNMCVRETQNSINCSEQIRDMMDMILQQLHVPEDFYDFCEVCDKGGRLLERFEPLSDAPFWILLLRRGKEAAERLVKERGKPDDWYLLASICSRIASSSQCVVSREECVACVKRGENIVRKLLEEFPSNSDYESLRQDFLFLRIYIDYMW